MTKAISLLGSTGSIGRQTLEVCAEMGIRVEALAAHHNIDLLEQQARRFRPRLVVLYEMGAALEMTSRLMDLDIRVAWGMEGLMEGRIHPFPCLERKRDPARRALYPQGTLPTGRLKELPTQNAVLSGRRTLTPMTGTRQQKVRRLLYSRLTFCPGQVR